MDRRRFRYARQDLARRRGPATTRPGHRCRSIRTAAVDGGREMLRRPPTSTHFSWASGSGRRDDEEEHPRPVGQRAQPPHHRRRRPPGAADYRPGDVPADRAAFRCWPTRPLCRTDSPSVRTSPRGPCGNGRVVRPTPCQHRRRAESRKAALFQMCDGHLPKPGRVRPRLSLASPLSGRSSRNDSWSNKR
jgi:hypothetical protein